MLLQPVGGRMPFVQPKQQERQVSVPSRDTYMHVTFRRSLIIGGVIGFSVAVAILVLRTVGDLLLPVYFEIHRRSILLIRLMLWPHDFGFTWVTADMDVFSVEYIILLLAALLSNAIIYSVIISAFWFCIAKAKIALPIPILIIAAYLIYLYRHI
jgi:hypothetical protein